MGWLDDLFGVENAETTKMIEKDVALDMLKDSKYILNATAMALTETTNPQLREILKKQLNEVVQNHFRLADLSVQNNWYMPHSAPIEQIKKDYEEAST
ncbi:coat F domain-containing protein [Desulfosporosinus orientis DSM 765]|uniref:Coat F domain-containing protein n=1 Tax=Desulfosporosinus orientis (strain ATCC 19365 / DSM 765 / NCIMB 8382 / VKM B-1628 / Singapore I) TaxID=768706 RepID=G7WDQ1_DESOD|nr:spore coat protein [Desulfosporosinus orientis]AET68376.1 coat F domain-containing protein [Desulfosporosinus orientis DSM 765]